MQQENRAGRAQPTGRTMLFFNLEREFWGLPGFHHGGAKRKKKKQTKNQQSLDQVFASNTRSGPCSLFLSQGCKFSLDIKAEAASIQG